ncbi:hypothetical protein AK812_SmicGene33730 [Symbiodinium microadriaticum]|uniref:Uncharacterized protein n=1 Tax=Symbiodinium microadriaticum TaxID=2951 RepID=A0A1Q9CQU8_SYMMI|nr:hypothetical protein AK812_SmicGene33730 [Symbiodinium microadriaticum]CAE7739028.1 unnamed protein product [Symbiodinium microadriaticum]CAE7898805.1 unnamed protein product [Symbiodinium sp. KB8]
MPTSRQKREQHATRCDASRGQQVMDRLVRVVQREQRLQATSGEQNANFNSQPTPGWRREWKTAAAQNGSLMGPDLSWADDQSWLQGSKACFDVQSSRKAAGYPSPTASAARKPSMPSLPALPKQISRASFQKYVAEVQVGVQQALLGPAPDAAELRRYTEELAQALRALTKPAPAATKARISEAMASVWDMRSNCAAKPEADLRALASALEALDKCSLTQEPAPDSSNG